MKPHGGSLLSRTYPLPAGPRVRLRLARRADLPAVSDLLAARGIDASELDLQRLVAFDPARRFAVSALAPLDGRETLVGIGAIDLDAEYPDTIVVDERLTEGLGELLGSVLIERAGEHARRVA